MKTRGKALLAALGLTALLATASIAQHGFAGGGPSGMGGGHGMGGQRPGGGPAMDGELSGLARVLNALDLSDDQRSEIGEILDNARVEVQSIRETFQGINPREEMMELFLQEDLSLSEVEAVFYEVDQIQDQVRDIMLEAFVDIHDVLTVEQLDTLAELIEQHSGMGGGPGMGGHPGMGGGGPGMGGPPPQGGHGFGF